MVDMSMRPNHIRQKRDVRFRSPKAILVAQYSLLVSIGTGTAALTYFTISGPDDVINLAGNLVNLIAVNDPRSVCLEAHITDRVHIS